MHIRNISLYCLITYKWTTKLDSLLILQGIELGLKQSWTILYASSRDVSIIIVSIWALIILPPSLILFILVNLYAINPYSSHSCCKSDTNNLSYQTQCNKSTAISIITFLFHRVYLKFVSCHALQIKKAEIAASQKQERQVKIVKRKWISREEDKRAGFWMIHTYVWCTNQLYFRDQKSSLWSFN